LHFVCTLAEFGRESEAAAFALIEQVDVARERERGGVVPEPSLDSLRVAPALEQQGCARMADVWKPIRGTLALIAAGLRTRLLTFS
jgi:hypothetical protein